MSQKIILNQNNDIKNVIIQIKIIITNVCCITIINVTYNMYYSTHTRNLVSIFEFFFCNEEPAVIGVCHLPVKVGCQSTLTLLLRRVSPHGFRIICGCGSLYI